MAKTKHSQETIETAKRLYESTGDAKGTSSKLGIALTTIKDWIAKHQWGTRSEAERLRDICISQISFLESAKPSAANAKLTLELFKMLEKLDPEGDYKTAKKDAQVAMERYLDSKLFELKQKILSFDGEIEHPETIRFIDHLTQCYGGKLP